MFKDPKTCLKTDIFEDIHDIDLVIFDSCYTSYTTLLSLLIYKGKYVIACSTASPNLGFLNDKFLDVLNKKTSGDITKYKNLIDLFIKRNSYSNGLYKQFNYRTDASLIDIELYRDIEWYVKQLKKNQHVK